MLVKEERQLSHTIHSIIRMRGKDNMSDLIDFVYKFWWQLIIIYVLSLFFAPNYTEYNKRKKKRFKR